jgi:transcription elongation factor GreB
VARRGDTRRGGEAAVSKAFTREDEEQDGSDERDPRDAAPSGPFRNYMTPAGYRRLNEELNRLWKEERPKLVETIAWAASNGDRSENGDYIYGKRRLREIDRRIRFLSKRLDTAEVVDNAGKNHDRVYFGATVTIEDEEGQRRVVHIVGADELDPARGRVSWISPVAKALMNAAVGDVVQVRTPSGPVETEVIDIRYEELP